MPSPQNPDQEADYAARQDDMRRGECREDTASPGVERRLATLRAVEPCTLIGERGVFMREPLVDLLSCNGVVPVVDTSSSRSQRVAPNVQEPRQQRQVRTEQTRLLFSL